MGVSPFFQILIIINSCCFYDGFRIQSLQRKSSSFQQSKLINSNFALHGSCVDVAELSSNTLMLAIIFQGSLFQGASVFTSGLVSGAVSRVCKELLLHPLDTIKARLQTLPSSGSVTSLNDNTLFSNLYSGIVPALVSSVPAGSIFFAVKDYTRRIARQSLDMDAQSATVLAVAVANIPYWWIRCPSERLKTRQQTGIDMDWSLQDARKEITAQWRKGGLRAVLDGFYGSYLSNYIYAMPADVIKFLVCKCIMTFFQPQFILCCTTYPLILC